MIQSTTPLIDVTAVGRPYAKQSFRYTKQGLHYQTENVKGWQDFVASVVMLEYGLPKYAFPLSVRLDFTLVRDLADVDNLSKAVLDALQGVAFVNDRQVKELLSTKAVGTPPGVRIRIWRLKNV